MRFTDNYRRRLIAEVRDRGHVIWDPQASQFSHSGARTYAFLQIADRLGGGADAVDLRRMWRKLAISYYNYKARVTNRRPKFHAELSFLNSVSADMLHLVSHKY
ncbi:hypothetical protein AAVH_23810 [Aphelenchoides avenae]|nr:hypothetical protein AAVH_23810 [Aphelenchus avenae]